jgi:DNA segregation ATPase FtsK/SpoIIIE, S-DNA-T family
MAKNNSEPSLGELFNFKDERVHKIMGFLCLLFSIYLFIAFVSYIFTWYIDQDHVLNFEWGLLFQSEIEVANWLGRLGAIISNGFFYWGFGVPSFAFVYIVGLMGVALIKSEPISTCYNRISKAFFLMLAMAILLEFIFGRGTAEFPWGGVFGREINVYLMNFIGTAGMIVLILFLILGLITWFTNPNYNDITPQQAIDNTRGFLSDMVGGRFFRPKSSPPVNPIQPRRVRTRANNEPIVSSKTPPNPNETLIEEDFLENMPAPQPSAPILLPKVDIPLASGAMVVNTPLLPNIPNLPNIPPLQGKDGQLALDLERARQDRAERLKSLRTGEADLEIQGETPTPPTDNSGGADFQKPSGPTQEPLSVQEENKKHSEPYDSTLDLSMYEHPSVSLLKSYDDQKIEIDRAELETNKDQIIETLLNYKIEITKIRATIGPTVTLYEIVPAPGVRISKIKNLEDDIALSLAALGIRIIAPIPGKGTIGIEVPNKNKQIVPLKELLQSDKFKRAKMDLPIALGKTIANEVFVADLAKMPHLLIAGATGQGKSVGINTILMSLLYKKHPSQVKLVLIDPKKVELYPYSKLYKHFLAFLPDQQEPIVTDTTKVIHTLSSLCIEMDTRYDLLKKANVRNITEYNEKFVARQLNPKNGHEFLPFIVLVIDEFADLIMTAGKEVELPIGRLAQLSRAVGIHLIIATQRPSVNIITGVIKANFPARIAFKVASKVDSRTILDGGGADQLIGRGDMLLSVGGDMIRLQSAFVDTPEVEEVIKFISSQQGYAEPFYLPEYVGGSGDTEQSNGKDSFSAADLDEMFPDAARMIVQTQHGSTSMIQRRMKLGYNRAGRIMDQLEKCGIVGPADGSKPREVLFYDETELERYLEDIKHRK